MSQDLVLLATSVLVVAGFLFQLLAGTYWFVSGDGTKGWSFSLAGLLVWMLACGIFCVIYPHAAPRHGKGR